MNTPQHPRNKESIEVDLPSPLKDMDMLRKERTDVLWELYHEDRSQARHYDDQRAKISNIIILGAVGLVGFIGHLEHADWPLTLCLMLLGFFGSFFTRAYTRLTLLYLARAKACLNELEDFSPRQPEAIANSKRPSEILRDANKAYQERSWKPRRQYLLPMFWPIIITLITGGFMIYILSL